jgi:predicted O-methyltransferase YrrM
MNYHFTEDYVTIYEKTWRTFLNHYIGIKNLHFLEVGSYEGRSTVWFLDNVLTDSTAQITCVDNCFTKNFYLNIAEFSEKVVIMTGDSQVVLRDKKFLEPIFDVIYIDGSHTAKHVLEDAILTLPSLKIGGIMIFDDYLWKEPDLMADSSGFSDAEVLRQEPKIAIDSFINVFGDSLEIIYQSYQMVFRKIESKF